VPSLRSPNDIVEGRVVVPVAAPKCLVSPRPIVMQHYDYATKDRAARIVDPRPKNRMETWVVSQFELAD
jgi:hypothetical protein